jgi:serine/threonine-protein kinase
MDPQHGEPKQPPETVDLWATQVDGEGLAPDQTPPPPPPMELTVATEMAPATATATAAERTPATALTATSASLAEDTAAWAIPVSDPATQDLDDTQLQTAGPGTDGGPPPTRLVLPETLDHSATQQATGGTGAEATAHYEPTPAAGAAVAAARAEGPARAASPSSIRYKTIRPHAKGGLGEVFVALDEELGREVALKEIQGRHANRAESRMRFLIEAEVTGGLEHPGIVPVYGLGRYPDGRPYYAMRFIRGRTLRDAIETYHDTEGSPRAPGQKTLEFRDLLNRMIDVCNALAYAHTRGILHRDIKPANIMLGSFGETLVVDWGLAKALDRPETASESELRPLRPLSAGQSGTETMYGSTVGTPNYMSPEQAAGALDRLGPPSDIYSLGATLYCILTGRLPFHEPQLGLLLEKVRRGVFLPPRAVDPQIPRALEAICLKAMALEPENRYPTARALAGDLEQWLADEPVSVYREPWTVRLARWARRHRTLVTTSAALVLAALVALSIGTVLIKQEQARTEANFQLARAAVDQMLTRLAEVDLADVPQMEPVRRTMLDKALRFYQKFLEEHGDDRSIRHETGRANLRLGDIEEMLGDYDASEPAYRRGLALLGALAADRPETADYRRDLASTWHRLGVLLKKSNRFTEAEAALHTARTLRQELVAAFPKNSDDKRDEMDSVYQLGTVLARLGRVKEVEASYAEAVEADRKLAAEHPDRPDYPRKLGRYLNNRGILLRNTNRDWRPAEAAFRQALELQSPLAEKSPTVAGLQWERARTTTNLAAALERTQGLEQAIPVYKLALGRFKQLADDFPSVPDYQNELAIVSLNLGLALRWEADKQAGDPGFARQFADEAGVRIEDAVATYRRLIEPGRFPHRPDFRQRLGQADCRLGILLHKARQTAKARPAFEEAIRVLEELVARYPQVPEYQSDLGLAYQNLSILQGKAQPREARRSLDAAIAHQQIALKANPKNADYRRFLLEHYFDLEPVLKALGDYAGAAAAADSLLQLLPGEPHATFRSARLIDLSATLVTGDTAVPDAKRNALAATRARLALERLRQAIKQGVKLLPRDLAPPQFDAVRKHSPEALEALKKALESQAAPAVG